MVSRRSKTSVKQRWPWPFGSVSNAVTLFRWRIFAADSIRAWPIARCWKASSKLVRLISPGVIGRNSSIVSRMRLHPRRLSSVIACPDKSHSSTNKHTRQQRPGHKQPNRGPNMRNFRMRKSFSDFMSAAIRWMHMPVFCQRKTTARLLR